MSLTSIAFILAMLAGIGLCIVVHPRYGLYTYLAVFYLHPPSRWWGEFLPDIRWSLLVAAITLAATFRSPAAPNRSAWYSSTGAVLLLTYVAWMWLQGFWAVDAEEHRTGTILFTKYIVLFFLVYRICDTEDEIESFLIAHIVGCLYLGLLAFSSASGGRLEGVGGPGIDDSNTLGMHMSTAAMVGATFLLSVRGWRWWLVFFSMPFILNTVVLAGSRGAFVALVAGGMAIMFLKPKSQTKRFYLFAALGAILFVMVAHETFWERIGTISAAVNEETEVDSSTEIRLALFEAQWEMAREYPLGAGHRGTAVLSPNYLAPEYLAVSVTESGTVAGRASHNTFFSTLVDQGFPGALMYLLVVFYCYRVMRGLRSKPESVVNTSTATLRAAIGSVLVVTLIGGVFASFLKAEVQIWFLALVAALAEIVRQREAVETVARPSTPSEREWAGNARVR